MRKLLFWLLPLMVWGAELPYFMNDKHGYIPNNSFDMGLVYNKMNDTLDVLGLKEGEVGSSASQTSLGDMDGYGAFLRYKLNRKTLFVAKYYEQNLNYGYGELKNQHTEFYFRRNFISRVFALDIGIMQNKSQPMVTQNLSASNSIVSEAINAQGIVIIPNTQDIFGSYTCNSAYSHCLQWTKPDGTILIEGTNSTSLNELANTNGINFKASIEDLSDETIFLRAIRSFTDTIGSKDIYFELRKTNINSSIVGSATYQNQTVSYTKSLDRDEKTIVFGWNYSTLSKPWSMDIGYEFNYILRDTNLEKYNTNQKLEFNLGYELFDHIKLFVGAKIMMNQFNADIPYLYNEYTQNSFDKKYGYVQSGLIVSF